VSTYEGKARRAPSEKRYDTTCAARLPCPLVKSLNKLLDKLDKFHVL
jgi:hypothetical protein